MARGLVFVASILLAHYAVADSAEVERHVSILASETMDGRRPQGGRLHY